MKELIYQVARCPGKSTAAKLASKIKPKLHPAQKALRQIRQRANDSETLRQHGPKFVEGLQCAANMLSDAINKGK